MNNIDLDFLKRLTPGVRGVRMAKALLSAALVATIGFTAVSAHAEAGDETAGSAPRAKKTKSLNKSLKKSAKAKSASPKASAGSAGGSVAVKTGPSSNGKLSREMTFDGSVVNGKYLASGEGVSTVENEKKLTNLIGMRADFKDRLGDQRAELRSASAK